MERDLSFGIYIHWPYCLSKCPYCDFYKEVRKDVNQEDIINSYIADLDFYHSLTADREVTSIFFGGGTPSLIKPSLIAKIINHITKSWKIASDVEVSLEANPNSHYPNMFSQLRSSGINRLSLGVQALNEDDLRFLGRTHSLSQAYQAIDEVLHNFDNHSIDLIYARPQQNTENWVRELKQAAALGLKHISLYQLTIEPNTVFAKKKVQLPDEEIATEMYLATEAELSRFGYKKYEVSNYAQAGFASKHNLIYWTGGEYIGVGPSAHGRLTSFDGNLEQNSDARNSRTDLYAQVSALRDFTPSSSSKPVKSLRDGNLEQNSDARNSRTDLYAQVSALRDFTPSSSSKLVKSLSDEKQEQNFDARRYKRFYATVHRCQLEEISCEERAEELLLMGLRLVEGINKADFTDICGINIYDFINQNHFQSLKQGGYIEEDEKYIRVTVKGFPILDFITLQLVA